MKPDNWQKIESVFHFALSLNANERDKYLCRIASENQSLRAEIESLIASFEKTPDFLEQPAFSLRIKALESELETSLVNQEIGFYKILDKLGSGGMGEVYLAEDTRLNRRVALKFLSTSLIDNKWAKKQLVKEAQAVAMLDHPNICHVYGIEEIGEYSFIVMQYIEGKTLADLISQTFIEEEQILLITQQITSAIAAAHKHGIIHRDIKTGNIMIKPEGQVKVLDFGLAKFIKQQNSEKFGEGSSLISQNGLVVGTVAYMSPEQLRAEKLDYRTDIFSLGTVFYEMVSGGHPFLQKSNAETISAILTKKPEPIVKLKNGNSIAFNHLVEKCLEKDKGKRYQSASELLLELQILQEKSLAGIKQKSPFRMLAASVFIVILLIIGISIYQRATRPRTLAILPFINKSTDQNNNYITGMAETLLNKISNSSQLNVIPLTLVANYKSTDDDPVEIGKALNAEAVLTGKITELDNQTILETELINIADGSILFYKKSPLIKESDILSIQDEISEKIISKLQSPISSNNKNNRAIDNTKNPKAFNYYLKGLEYWRTRDKDNIEKAIDAFNQSIAIDPDNARAHAGLAYIYVLRSSVNYNPMRAREAMTIAKVEAQEAINIDKNLCESHAALGAVLHKYDWNWEDAEKEYQQAINIDPEYSQTYYWYSDLLAITKRPEKALYNSLKARELDPYSAYPDFNTGRVLYYNRQYDQAIEPLKVALSKDPKILPAKSVLGLVYLQKGKYDDALKLFEEIYALDKKSYAAMLGYTYGKMGRKAEALKILNELENIAKESYIPAQERAIIYIGLGDKDNAFIWLDKAFQDRFAVLPAINVEPLFDDLRNDARFQDLLIRMNLNKKF